MPFSNIDLSWIPFIGMVQHRANLKTPLVTRIVELLIPFAIAAVIGYPLLNDKLKSIAADVKEIADLQKEQNKILSTVQTQIAVNKNNTNHLKEQFEKFTK